MYKNYGDYNQAYPKLEEEILSQKYSYDLLSGSDLKMVLEKQEPECVIVYAWAPWCNPCKRASLKYERLGEKFQSFIETKQLLLLKDNIDLEETSHHRPMVDVVPSFFVYIRGNLQTIFTGVDFDKLEDLISQYFSYPSSEMFLPTKHSTSPPPLPLPSSNARPQIKKSMFYPPKNM